MPRKPSREAHKRPPKAKSQAEQGVEAGQKDYLSFLKKADPGSGKKK
jgi:hypothetical protein